MSVDITLYLCTRVGRFTWMLAVFFLLMSCASGLSVREIQSSPVSVAFSYRDGFPEEKEVAIEKSTEHCGKYSTRAELVGERTLKNDRREISFKCMPL